jgi:hypothetical protein
MRIAKTGHSEQGILDAHLKGDQIEPAVGE